MQRDERDHAEIVMMVDAYFNTLLLYTQSLSDEELMNLSLLSRPKRVKATSQTLYLYAPAIVTSGMGLKAGTVVRVLDVYDAKNYNEVSLRVMIEDVYQEHVYRDRPCRRYHDDKSIECECLRPTEEMEPRMKEAVFHILLSDLGK